MSNGAFQADKRTSPECLEHYQTEGWVLIKNFFDYKNEILPIHREINNLIDQKRRSIGLSPVPNLNTEINVDLFLDLCRHNRGFGGHVYKACRHLPSTLSLLTGDKMTQMAKTLMKTEFLNLIPYVPIRVDIRGEEKYLLNWHQDYPYIQGSMNGVVMWSPLFNQRLHEGGVAVIPKSHSWGLKPVHILDAQNKNNKNGGNSIEISNVEELDQMPSLTTAVDAADVLIFHTLLVHKSLPLKDDRVRWSMQIRFCDFNYQDAVLRGWPNGMIENNWFEFDHPEYVIQDQPATSEATL